MVPVPLSLPPVMVQHRRGAWAGQLDDLSRSAAVSGWACPIPPEAATAPLQVRLVIEDLLHPDAHWPLAELPAHLQRDDLIREGLHLPCGFLLQPPLPRPLPMPELLRGGRPMQPPAPVSPPVSVFTPVAKAY